MASNDGQIVLVRTTDDRDFIQSWLTSSIFMEIVCMFENIYKYMLLEDIQEMLDELIRFVHADSLEATENLLWRLLPSEWDRSYSGASVLMRAKVYSMLIAVALGLEPQDILKIRQAEIVEDTKLSERVRKWKDDVKVVPGYLLKEMEEDDDLMTIIFCDPIIFKIRPVPYFDGCTLSVFQQVSSLWLSKDVLTKYYFNQLINPIIEKVKQYSTSKNDKYFFEAKLALFKHLKDRDGKAGARLLWFITMARHDHPVVGELINELLNLPGVKLEKCFLTLWSQYWSDIQGYDSTDRVIDGQGLSICVGEHSAYTDQALLCWAARRGYADLIWFVMQTCQPASKSARDYSYKKYVFDVEVKQEAWKVALWCAVRHREWTVIRELSDSNWNKCIDFNDYPPGWLPPLHLVALQGDSHILDFLCDYLPEIMADANKEDYLRKTPLDYAIHGFKNESSTIRAYFTGYVLSTLKRSQIKTLQPYKDVIKKLLDMPGVREHLNELFNIYINQTNNGTVLIGAALIANVTFVGWLQPPLGYKDYFQFPQPHPPAPTDTYQSYVAIEGHLSIELFVLFNSLSFFLAIATMFIGADVAYFHHNQEKAFALIDMQRSFKWMFGYFVSSMLCIMVAFICAGVAILPPITRLKWTMIISLALGGGICTVHLSWIFLSLARNWIFSIVETGSFRQTRTKRKWDSPTGMHKSLTDGEDLEKVKRELEQVERRQAQPKAAQGNPQPAAAHQPAAEPAQPDSDPEIQPEDPYQKIHHLKGTPHSEDMPRSHEVTHSTEQSYKEIFDRYDQDMDGFITAAELRSQYTSLRLNVTDDEFDDVFRHADEDGDGRINYEEFVKYIMPVEQYCRL